MPQSKNDQGLVIVGVGNFVPVNPQFLLAAVI